MEDRIKEIIQRWFVQEPAMFQIICTHALVENRAMKCPVRSGKGRLEYNPDFLAQMSDPGLDEALRTEACRILLKHPYERRPDGCSQQAIGVGSNITIGDNYEYGNFRIDKPGDYGLEKGMPYEWYARQTQSMLQEGPGEDGTGAGGDSDSAGGGSGDGTPKAGDRQKERSAYKDRLRDNAERNHDLASLWEEDDLQVALINGIIENCQSWGSLAGAFAEKIKASAKAKINWRTVFSGFRASILSSRRKMTRMRPSRRFGFDQMGSTRQFNTRLLVAVDVSGSISSGALSYFYGVINSAFRYGFESIDVIQFDCGVRVVQNLKKVAREVVAVGRGGTSFQEPIEYAGKMGYDGLLILTDGFAPEPEIPENFRPKIIWVCKDSRSYDSCHRWMEKSGRVCTMELG